MLIRTLLHFIASIHSYQKLLYSLCCYIDLREDLFEKSDLHNFGNNTIQLQGSDLDNFFQYSHRKQINLRQNYEGLSALPLH